MSSVARKFGRSLWRYHCQGLRVLSLLLFCFISVAVPQVKVRVVESPTIELLPTSDSTGGSEHEEASSTQLILERGSHGRWKLLLRDCSTPLTASQGLCCKFPGENSLVAIDSFSERLRPLRC